MLLTARRLAVYWYSYVTVRSDSSVRSIYIVANVLLNVTVLDLSKWSSSLSLSVCVCVCVCVDKRTKTWWFIGLIAYTVTCNFLRMSPGLNILMSLYVCMCGGVFRWCVAARVGDIYIYIYIYIYMGGGDVYVSVCKNHCY